MNDDSPLKNQGVHQPLASPEASQAPSSLPISLLALALVVALVEVFVGGQTRGLEEQVKWELFVVLGLFPIWFWCTASWIAWNIANRLSAGKWARAKSISILAMGLAILSLLLYGISWGFYLRTGRFTNLETIQFALNNRGMLWNYLRQAERSQFWAFGFVVLAATASPFLILGLLKRLPRWMVDPRGPRTHGRAGWWVLTCLLWLALLSVTVDSLEMRRGVSFDILARGLNPLVALAISGEELLFRESIEQDLDVSQLVPIERRAVDVPKIGSKRRPSIVFVAIESLRHDVVHQRWQGREIMPNLNALANRGLQLTRAYSQSTHSDYSDVCAYSSLYPLRSRGHHYYQPSDPWPKTLIYDLLKPEGYATAIFSSQNEAWGGMDHFLNSPNLDRYLDAQNSGQKTQIARLDTGAFNGTAKGRLHFGKLDDAYTTKAAIAWIAKQVATGKPYFLGLNFQTSHFPYTLPPGTPRPFMPSTIDFDASFIHYPRERVEVVRNAYFNALRYCDQQLGNLIAALRELGQLEDTILVVYGENGEAFHENGLVTHAQAPHEPAIHVASVIHAPKLLDARTDDYPFELIDLVPTVLGLAERPPHANFQGINALSPQRPALEKRLLFFHVENPAARADAVLLAGRWKFQRDRMTGRESLFDLNADPGERKSLIDLEPARATELRHLLAEWRKGQLAYYHYPFYYEHYYPPRPPRLEASHQPRRIGDDPRNDQADPSSKRRAGMLFTASP